MLDFQFFSQELHFDDVIGKGRDLFPSLDLDRLFARVNPPGLFHDRLGFRAEFAAASPGRLCMWRWVVSQSQRDISQVGSE